MPTPSDFPERFRQYYHEVKEFERRQLRRADIVEAAIGAITIVAILIVGIAWWSVTP